MDLSLFKYYASGIIIFVSILSIGEYLFSHSYPRRARFAAKWWFTRLTVLVASTAIEFLHFYVATTYENPLLTNLAAIFVYVLTAAMLLAAMNCTYDKGMAHCVISLVLAYLCQNIYYNIYTALVAAFGFEIAIYTALGDTGGLMVCSAIQYVLALIVLVCTYAALSRRLKDIYSAELKNKSIFAISAATFFVVLVLNSCADIFAGDADGTTVFVKALIAICCIFIFIIYENMLESAAARHDLELITELNDREYRYYNKLKENMDLIEIKCHDIKHYIAAAGSGAAIDLSQFSKQVDIYDNTVKTGNEILDTLVAERSLYCRSRGITLTVMADATRLDYIDKADMCSLFGNILENAVEAADKVKEESKRTVSLSVRPVAGQISVSAENYFLGSPHIKDGMPVSEKGESAYHGFGLKSIKYIAAKYGGVFQYKIEGDIFRIFVLLPSKKSA